MTLKEVRKKYQGKYFKCNRRYYKFIRIAKESDSLYYLIYIECVDTLLGCINNNTTLLIRFDDEAFFNNQFKKTTKGEFNKYFNKINQQILNQNIGATTPEIKINGYGINDFIYYKPVDFDNHIALTDYSVWPDYIK